MSDDAWSSYNTQPPDLGHFQAFGERAENDPAAALRDPAQTALDFFRALGNLEQGRPVLELVVTPESRDNWGDFTSAARRLASITHPGVGDSPRRAVGAVDVAYANVLEGVTQSFRFTAPELIPDPAAVITLVWRPEFSTWLVHGFGPAVLPQDLPRSSPGTAP